MTIAWPLSLSLVAAAIGCSGRSGSAPAAARDATATDAAAARIEAARPDAAVDARPPGPALAPITVEEVKAVVPVPAEARVVTPHRKDAGRERVEVTFCFDRGKVAELGKRVVDKLAADGWKLDGFAPDDRIDLAGQRGELRLAGMLRRGPWAACPGDQGQTYVVLGVHRPAP